MSSSPLAQGTLQLQISGSFLLCANAMSRGSTLFLIIIQSHVFERLSLYQHPPHMLRYRRWGQDECFLLRLDVYELQIAAGGDGRRSH